ncbi:MAG: hypothetical protein ACRDNP_01750 [Gaiellaceae bacterium]
MNAHNAELDATDGAAATTAIRPAKVVVVLNSSDQIHFVESGRGPHLAARPPWAELSFLADHDITARLVPLLEEGDVDAVVFASNAFLAPVARRAVATETFIDLWNDDGPARDVGVVVLHQYLGTGERLSLDFLGSAAFSLLGERARGVEDQKIQFADDWCFVRGGAIVARDDDERFRELARGWGPKGHALWARFDFRCPTQWEPLAWEDNPLQPLVGLCAVGDRVVAACRVPIDLTGATHLLGSLVAASLRPRGALLIQAPSTSGTAAFSTALASAIDRRRFVERVSPASPADVDPRQYPFRFFDELIVAPEWRIDEIEPLNEQTVLGKLEQGGSLVATFIGPESRSVAVRLSGQPQYAERANRLADWLVARLDQFRGDIWAMRGLAEAVAAIESAYVDPLLIPHALRRAYVCHHLADPLVKRIKGDNVDELVLSTLGTYCALKKLGRTDHEGLLKWVDRNLDREVPSVLAQALTLEPHLGDDKPGRLDQVNDAVATASQTNADDGRLLGAYAAVLAAGREPAGLEAVAADRSLGLGVQAELLLAVVRHELPPSGSIFDLARNVRERIDRLAAGQGGLEAVCIGNAALIELARKQGIGPNAEVRGRPRETDARTVESTELIKNLETAERDVEAARNAGRLAVTALVGIIVLLAAVAIVAIVGWWSGGDARTKFGLAVAIFGLMTTLTTYILKKARDFGIPRWKIFSPST